MKSLRESLFDKDLVEKDIAYQLKNTMIFDGQYVYPAHKDVLVDMGLNPNSNHVLDVIDWKKVRKDLKEYGGDKLDLGLYEYSHINNIRTADVVKKTEMFAKLILILPYGESIVLGSYNSRFRDEFEDILNKYIKPEYFETKKSRRHSATYYPSAFYFEVIVNHWGVDVCLHHYMFGDQQDLLKWEFLSKD